MAYTVSKPALNQVKVEAGDTFSLVVDVYQLDEDYAWQPTNEDVSISIDGSQIFEMANDGIYKLDIVENSTTYIHMDYSMYDINNCLLAMVKKLIVVPNDCTDPCKEEAMYNFNAMQLLINTFFSRPNDVDYQFSEITAEKLNELKILRDALERAEEYCGECKTIVVTENCNCNGS